MKNNINMTITGILGPSQFSASGYMGNDVRTLEQVISDDAQKMRELSLTKEEAAAILRTIYVKAERNLGKPIRLSENVSAVHEEARGRIPSPFSGDGTFHKGQVLVNGVDKNNRIAITPLSIHLIERFGFFQGKGSEYRIEPEAVSLLGKFNI
jgi:hypothetical protein